MGYIFDGANKIINLTTGTTSVSVRDLWSRYSEWVPIDDNSKYELAFRFVGGDTLPGDRELGLTYFMINGWKIQPYSGNHTLNIDGNLYSDDGASPYTNAIGGYNVMIISSVSSLVDSSIKQLPEIEYASYNGGITIDGINGTDSAEYPYGTPKFPCKTLANAFGIGTARGFFKVFLKSDLLLSHIPDGLLMNIDLIGLGGYRAHSIIVDNVLATGCTVENVRVVGIAKPGSSVKLTNCDISNFENVAIIATDCFIQGGIYENTELSRCRVEGAIKITDGGTFSGIGIVFEGDTSSIDCLNGSSTISLDIDSGYVKILNVMHNCLLEFNLRGGQLEIDNSCVGGELYVEGYGKLYNTSQMIIKGNNLQSVIIPEAVWDTKIADHQLEGSVSQALVNGLGSSLTKEGIREELDANSITLSTIMRLSGDIHKINGLDNQHPTVVNKDKRTTDNIEQTFTTASDGTVTITRL